MILPSASDLQVLSGYTDGFEIGALENLLRTDIVHKRSRLETVQLEIVTRVLDDTFQRSGSEASFGVFLIHPIADVAALEGSANNTRDSHASDRPFAHNPYQRVALPSRMTIELPTHELALLFIRIERLRSGRLPKGQEISIASIGRRDGIGIVLGKQLQSYVVLNDGCVWQSAFKMDVTGPRACPECAAHRPWRSHGGVFCGTGRLVADCVAKMCALSAPRERCKRLTWQFLGMDDDATPAVAW